MASANNEMSTSTTTELLPEQEWAVSVVMVKEKSGMLSGVINTQNTLYQLNAVSKDEAQGKAIRIAQSDFPRHRFHTVCAIEITRTSSPTAAPAGEVGDEQLLNQTASIIYGVFGWVDCEQQPELSEKLTALQGVILRALQAAYRSTQPPPTTDARQRARELVDEWRKAWRGMSDACTMANRVDLIDRISRLSPTQPALQQAVEVVLNMQRDYEARERAALAKGGDDAAYFDGKATAAMEVIERLQSFPASTQGNGGLAAPDAERLKQTIVDAFNEGEQWLFYDPRIGNSQRLDFAARVIESLPSDFFNTRGSGDAK